jgi:hypothetical protein
LTRESITASTDPREAIREGKGRGGLTILSKRANLWDAQQRIMFEDEDLIVNHLVLGWGIVIKSHKSDDGIQRNKI